MSKLSLALNPVRPGAEHPFEAPADARRDAATRRPGGELRDEAGAIAAAVQVFEDGLIGLRARATVADDAASAAADADAATGLLAGIAGQTSLMALRTPHRGGTGAHILELLQQGEEITGHEDGLIGLRARATVADDAASAAADADAATGLLAGIAGQTSLMALRAAIEAARGGDGLGFAAAAAEVRDLAGQMARATDTIVAQVGQIQAAAERAQDAAARTHLRPAPNSAH
ncbi:methyl-accepting chemotaxis protein [Methylobacterium oryzae]|uniref:methyl-accepting chemotaxis protein n=1 Tax=Methylobacterium oryzae TaxID=334852 RepID=UPI002F354FF6